ncbi:unnamed protein product [Lactuca virosa]|uniref:Uncharacterized protein n=1 Tax=Lactuca virosa TaxID=75947 RepID=A0AAU9LTC8_9ASTR|nr:unnamed protein product [Lactuca virosa]
MRVGKSGVRFPSPAPPPTPPGKRGTPEVATYFEGFCACSFGADQPAISSFLLNKWGRRKRRERLENSSGILIEGKHFDMISGAATNITGIQYFPVDKISIQLSPLEFVLLEFLPLFIGMLLF